VEILHNLEQRPSHQSNSQPHVKPMEEVTIPIDAQQTQPFNQNV